MTSIENKKIILQIIPSMEMGGAEIGTIEISRYMKKKGWNVIVASSGGSLVNKLNEEGRLDRYGSSLFFIY